MDNNTTKRKRAHDWQISTPTADDAPRLASLQVSAFNSNALFKLQFPTPEVVESYQIYLSARVRAEIETPHSEVLVVKSDDNDGEIISVAIWRAPSVIGKGKEDATLNAKKTWPMGTNTEMIEKWAGEVNEAYRSVMGERACYRTCIPV